MSNLKNNTINITLMALIIIIFAGYFSVMNLTYKNDIAEKFKMAESYTRKEDWSKVLEITIEIEESWNSQKHFLMLNFGEAEFSLFENHLNYAIGGAVGKQLDTTLSNIIAAKDLWQNMNKVVPEP